MKDHLNSIGIVFSSVICMALAGKYFLEKDIEKSIMILIMLLLLNFIRYYENKAQKMEILAAYNAQAAMIAHEIIFKDEEGKEQKD